MAVLNFLIINIYAKYFSILYEHLKVIDFLRYYIC